MTQEQVSPEEVRLALFQLLQVAYAAPPTAELAEALTEVAAAYGAGLGCELPRPAPMVPERDVPEFHRLFVGPGRLVAPPYESAYRNPARALMQAETLAVRAFYREHGLALPPGLNEPDDHIAFELEFYARLQARSLAPDAGPGPAEAQRRFLAEHLARWVPEFCRRIQAGSRSPFYRTLAALTHAVITLEERRLNPAIHTKEECTA